MDHQAVASARASRKVTSGQKHKGKTYLEVFTIDPDYCDWLQTEAAHFNEATRQLLTYLEMMQHAHMKAQAGRHTPSRTSGSSSRPSAKSQRARSPESPDIRMAVGRRKRVPSDESWEDGAV